MEITSGVFVSPDSIVGRAVLENPTAASYTERAELPGHEPFLIVRRAIYERVGALLIEQRGHTAAEVWTTRDDVVWVSVESAAGKRMLADAGRYPNSLVYLKWPECMVVAPRELVS
jgi:hypothetical protein